MPIRKIRTDRYEQTARVRAHRRPMSPPEGAAMASRGNLQRALARLRPVRWPAGPLSVTEVAFVLNVTAAAVSAAIAEGRLQAVRVGRRHQVRRADVEALLWPHRCARPRRWGWPSTMPLGYVAGGRRSPASWNMTLEA